MVLSHPFHCPTRLIEGHAFDEAAATLIAGRSWAVVTSAGWLARGAIDRLAGRCGAPAAIIAGVEPNPKATALPALADALPDVEIVVAFGGGSVMDAAKAIVAVRALGEMAPLMAHLREGTDLPAHMSPVPVIAVPTTSGTGSEVTRWGTIWGDDGIKYSIKDAKLYPSHAVLDPTLCRSMPRALTLSTGLDALSHAMESVWNRRHTAVTDALAAEAIRILYRNLDQALARPADTGLRRRMQTASLLAGLAMGTTQTALAHSISYPFTAHFGVPHGLACSFTLAEVARYNMDSDAARLAPIAAGLGCAIEDIPAMIEAWFLSLGVGEMIAGYITPAVVDDLDDSLITRARAANNLREADGPAARNLVRAALEALCPVPKQRAETG